MEYDIYINSSIGWPFSAEYVRQELNKYQGQPCNVYISSLGGSVLDAVQIRQMFSDHGQVTCYLHGFVASAATIIAMGAKKIVMGEFALFLMHRCTGWVEKWGQLNAEELARAIEELQHDKKSLETIDQTIANIYVARCGKKIEDVVKWMEEAEWVTAATCLERGLIDEVCKDDCKQEPITAAFRSKILACGLPMPADRPTASASQEEEKRTSRNILAGLRAMFTSKEANSEEGTAEQATEEPEQNSLTNTTTMNENYTEINALLNIQGVEEQEGNVRISAEQMTALNGALASRSSEISTLQNRVAELTEQVKNLQAQDGDQTIATEGDDGNDIEDHTTAAREAFNALKGLL